MKRITLMRHAKATEPTQGGDDHARPLSLRGHQQATTVGRGTAGEVPDLVLCSTSVRTRETLDGLLATWKRHPAILYQQELYLADAAMLTRRIEVIAPSVESAWVIAHNPGIHDLARELATVAVRGRDYPELQQKFPTAARAVFESDTGSWAEFRTAILRLVAFEA